jgi:hypothetical protein
VSTAKTASNYEKCRHFCGIQNVCGAGIDPRTVRDESEPGPYRWPCLQFIGRPAASDTCPKREWMTAEEHAAHETETRQAFSKAEAAIAAGKCHECGRDIEPSRIVGKCKYGACGHRIGQVS